MHLLFLFQKKIYNVRKGKQSIYDYSNSGPCFYGFISIPNKMIENRSKICVIEYNHSEDMSIDYEINKGEQNFNIQEIEVYLQEIEVYQVLFN